MKGSRLSGFTAPGRRAGPLFAACFAYVELKNATKIRALQLGLCSAPASILCTMRLWLLLVSLFLDLSPPGEADCVMGYISWPLWRKLFLHGEMAPKGAELVLRNSMYDAVQHKQRRIPLFWANPAHKDHGWFLSHQDTTGTIHTGCFPMEVCLA